VPPKTVEQTRRLVEQDQVAFMFGPLGTPTNNATRKYLNEKKVPTLFLATGATQFGDYQKYPWTMGWQPTYQVEGHAYAKYTLATKPAAKVAVLYQNDDSGKDYLKGFKDGLGEANAKLLVATASYEVTDPTVDSQIVSLQNSGADTLFMTGIPKFTAMGMRKVYDVGWRPTFFISSTGSSVATAVTPAGPEKCVGVMTCAYLKDPTDKQWADDAGFRGWLEFMKKSYPEGDLTDFNNAYGYSSAQTIIDVLKRAGNDLSRPNLMAKATSLDLTLPMLQPGIRLTTGPTDYYPVKQVRLVRFDGHAWVPFGEVISG
jgi:ABC-type branched-subunit amino acid transport system substrate-binding protein